MLCLCIKDVFTGELSPEMETMLKSLHNTCIEETGAQEAAIADANKGKFSEEKNFKMEEDGAIDFETLLGLVPDSMQEYAQKAAAKCNIAPEGDACETAYKFNMCAYEADPKYRIDINNC
ncbi:hypothetical protein PGB90_003256 [Kerria lacca]